MKIFLIGFMGSGKSYWGRLLSGKLGFRFFDLDEQVAEHAGKSIVDIFQSDGEEKFRLMEKEVLHILTESHDNFVMACGGGTPCYFKNIDYMNSVGTTVWLNAPFDIIFNRLIEEKEKRPLISGFSEVQLENFIARKFADRRIYYEQAAVFIDNDPVGLEHLIQKIFHA